MNSSKGARRLLYKYETKEGTITIYKSVIGKIILEATGQFGGKVLLSNYKGKTSGFVTKIGGVDDSNFMEISIGEDGLDLRFYIVIRFGTSINRVTEMLIARIKKNTDEITGLKVNSIVVVVTGIVSKQMVRRYIEVRG